MIQNLLSNIRREDFEPIANELMNHFCVLKHDLRYDGDVIFRFAEIEFYLYDASEQEVDVNTYSRDCLCGEWFFHNSGVDIAFEAVPMRYSLSFPAPLIVGCLITLRLLLRFFLVSLLS